MEGIHHNVLNHENDQGHLEILNSCESHQNHENHLKPQNIQQQRKDTTQKQVGNHQNLRLHEKGHGHENVAPNS